MAPAAVERASVWECPLRYVGPLDPATARGVKDLRAPSTRAMILGVPEKPEEPKSRWPEDASGKAERDDAGDEGSAVDQVPMSALAGDTILGGHFVDRVRRWGKRRRRGSRP
jgi:hypothetical protein